MTFLVIYTKISKMSTGSVYIFTLTFQKCISIFLGYVDTGYVDR